VRNFGDNPFVSEHSEPVTRGPRRARWLALALVFAWSLAETPVEIAVAQGAGEVAAILVSKSVLGMITLLAARRVRAAELAFTLGCVLSVAAILPRLYVEAEVFPLSFFLSLVECILKTAAALLFLRRVPRDQIPGSETQTGVEESLT
jgi:hypothetical protein